MSRSTKSKKSSIDKQMVVIGLIGLVITWFVFGPVVSKLRTRLTAKNRLSKEYDNLSTKLEILEGIDSIQVEERVKKMEEVFPSKKPVVQLMGSLNQLASEYNLSFGGITLRPGSLSQEQINKKSSKNAKSILPNELSDLKFGFQVAGGFDSIADFMNQIENLAPLMKIESLALSIKTDPFFQADSLSVVADIEVIAYYQSPPKTLGSVSKKVSLLSREDEVVLNRMFGFRAFEAVIPVAQTGKVDLFSTGLEAPL